MKRFCEVCAVALFAAFAVSACSRSVNSFERMRRNGLKGTITYHVVDDDGNPVSNADVKVWFGRSTGKHTVVRAKTDADGFATLSGRVNLDAVATITKSGYYRSYDKYTFFTLDESKMKGDSWATVPTNTVDLRIEREPKMTSSKRARLNGMEKRKKYRFDFITGGLVDCDSMCTNACLAFAYNVEPLDDTGEKFRVIIEVSADGGGGLQLQHYTGSSNFLFPYNAPSDGYAESIHFSNKPKPGEHSFINDDERKIVIFKVYEKSGGEFVDGSCHYGIISLLNLCRRFGRDTADLDFFYYYNDKVDDMNTEYVH